MNLPNKITTFRLVLTAIFIAVSIFGTQLTHLIALICFILAALSDFLDGYLARKLGLVTALGKLLDPLADKILVAAAFVHLTALGYCPAWLTATIIVREFLVTGLRQIAIEQGVVIPADKLGKWKTTFQMSYCIGLLFWLAFPPSSAKSLFHIFRPESLLIQILLYASLATTVLSGWNYTWKSRKLFSDSNDVS